MGIEVALRGSNKYKAELPPFHPLCLIKLYQITGRDSDINSNGNERRIQLVHMADREGDFFEFFWKAIEMEQDYLIRVVQNQVTDQKGQRLFELVQQEPAACQFRVNIPRDTRRNLKVREVTLEIFFSKATSRYPNNSKKSLVRTAISNVILFMPKKSIRSPASR